MKPQCNVFWFRRDLRFDDNVGLYQALKSDLPVLPVFIFDKTILSKLKNKDDLRVNFIHKRIKQMNSQLKVHGSSMITMHSTAKEAWKLILNKYDVKCIFVNEDYEPNAIKRDTSIKNIASKLNVNFKSFKDQCIFHKSDVVKSNNQPYNVFTPYKNKWLETLRSSGIKIVQTKSLFDNFINIKNIHPPELKELGFDYVDYDFGDGSIENEKIRTYDETRDFPALNSTSRISHHLRFGTVSVRKCIRSAMKLNKIWLSELIWREFFMQILYHYPHVVNAPFRDKYKHIEWRNNKSEFNKWKQGKTGHPIVDAGMRELNQTGFMHNRVRMITASFLVKHLLVDWQLGEKYFAEKLLDFELSSNNGNWQWVAGTGCDAAPYFRIFNPEIQTKKFDNQFEYINTWAPEYSTNKYPAKIVDHKFAYNRALSQYKQALSLIAES